MNNILSVINKILDIDQTLTGINYLKVFIRNISQYLEVKYVLIGHPIGDCYKEIQTDAVWAGDDYYENFIYDLEYTPCEKVLSGNRVCIHESDVANIFPQDLLLAQMGVESYVGVPVTRAKENGMSGLLVLLDDKPMKDAAFLASITEFLALRASAELEKFRSEETLIAQVEQRTLELNATNNKLEETISYLKETQKKLVESEKMTSMGNLVAGVAHEINRPIGIGITTVTHFMDISKDIQKKYDDDNMSKEDFELYLNTSKNLSRQIHNNLRRTADLINNFKQVAANTTNEDKKVFNIKRCINNILLATKSVLKNTQLRIVLNCEDIEIYSYSGVYLQIITQLLSNSVIHGYEDKKEGTISINIFKENNALKLVYKDDGKGITQNNLPNIFEPFFTTNREYGNIGLGLNIIYNIITSNLQGSIECQSSANNGTIFNISIPLENTNSMNMNI